jgi:hypothetical protein
MSTLNVLCIFVCAISKSMILWLWVINYKNYPGSQKAQDFTESYWYCINLNLWFCVMKWELSFLQSSSFFVESQILFQEKSSWISQSSSSLFKKCKLQNPSKMDHISWNVRDFDTHRHEFVISSFLTSVVISSEPGFFPQISDLFPTKICWDLVQHELLMQKCTKVRNFAKIDTYHVKCLTFRHKSIWFCDFEFLTRIEISLEPELFSQVSHFFPTKISWDLAEHELHIQKYTKFEKCQKLTHFIPNTGIFGQIWVILWFRVILTKFEISSGPEFVFTSLRFVFDQN